MFLIDYCIKNPVKVAVAVILAVLFGIVSLLATPVQLTPEVVEPEITVTTRWPGASAQEVEREIVDEQEEQLKSVEGLREFTSESSDSLARITLKFEVGTDLDQAQSRVRDKLSQVAEYPPDAREPTIATVDPNANAIAWLMLKPIPPTVEELKTFVGLHPHLAEPLGEMLAGRMEIVPSVLAKLSRTYPEIKTLLAGKNDPNRMRKFAEEYIEARLERVDGVANANVLGGREEEMRVIVDPVRLAAQQLTIADVRSALVEQNKNVSGGDIREGKFRNVLRTVGQFDAPEKVAETIVAYRDNKPIRIRDVAEVRLDYKKEDGVVRQKGVEALAVNAQQYPGSNLLSVMGPPLETFDFDGNGQITQVELDRAKRRYGDSIRIAVAELNLGVLKQRGMWLEQVYDQTEYVNSATALVTGNIYIGGTLAVLVLLIFLRSARSVLIIGLAIPISVIATFLFVKAFGRSINVISLAGMAFAVGMVVDNAIVVLENIYRHYQITRDPEYSTSRGATEVWGAVLASTLTTLAVFIPVIFSQGQAGQLFRDIAIAISCAVALSLIVSITVVPVAASRLLRRGEQLGKTSWGEKFLKRIGLIGFGQAFVNALVWLLGRLHQGRSSFLVRVAVVVIFMTVSIGGTWMLLPKAEYLPEGNRNLVIGILIPPAGYNINQLIRLAEQIEPLIAPYWEAEAGSPEEQALDGPRIGDFFFVARDGRLIMGARAADPLKGQELVEVLRRTITNIPGMMGVVQQTSLFERGISGGRSIDIEITGPELETLVYEAQTIFGMCMKEFPPAEGHQIQPIPSLDLSNPELQIHARLEKSVELGMNTADLGYTVDALVDGAYAGDYWHEGRKIDLVIFGAENYVQYTNDVGNLPVATPSGKLVTLDSVADIKLTSGPEKVNHSERLRTITLRLRPATSMPLEEAMDVVNERISAPMMETPTFESGLYHIRLAGTADKLEDARQDMQWDLALALLITYLLMAALFESFFYPAIVMTSVFLAMVGGVAGLALLNVFSYQALDMLTMLGFVILIGTVVNNAILIVHQALNHMREENMPEREAIVESVRTRVRPIFMTTVTTVLGMLPLVLPVPSFSGGELEWRAGAGSELYRGLGSVILGGLTVGTIFTLVLIPVGFSLALDVKRFLHDRAVLILDRFLPTHHVRQPEAAKPRALVEGNGNGAPADAEEPAPVASSD